MNNILALQWIRLFHQTTKTSQKGTYRMLICDQFASHLTYEFVKFCEDQQIILFFLPPHSSHLLQPLDVGVFSAYKHWHSEWVYDATVAGYEKITKDDFLGAVHQIRTKIFKPSTIKLGFKLTGLWPIDPQRVIKDLVGYNTPSPPSSVTSASTLIFDLSTPKTLERVQRLEDRLDDMIQRSQRTPTRALIRKLAKAAKEFSYIADECARNVENSAYLRQIRYAREKVGSRKSTKLTGIVHSSQLERIKRLEKIDDDIRALDKLRPYWKREIMPALKRKCRSKGIRTAK
jgi:uncharacterized protein YaaR (DUF327 family)